MDIDDLALVRDLREQLNELERKLGGQTRPAGSEINRIHEQLRMMRSAIVALSKRLDRLEAGGDESISDEEREVDDHFLRLQHDYYRTQEILADIDLARHIKKR